MRMKHAASLLLIQAAFIFALSAAGANTRLAIGTMGLKPEDRDASLADVIAAQLTTAPGFDLVERRELDAVLKEASLGLSGVVRAKDAVRFGKLLRADKFLLGSSLSINKTNRLVVRLVDARTGTIQAVDVFRDSGSLESLAGEIARFVREESKRPPNRFQDFLAIGVIQNLGVNNRFSDFPAQMRGSVTAHLSGKMTMLERDVISFLANEVRMDLAGLTDREGEQRGQMQFGFWIVDGFYQSYEVADPEVQLRLRVERVNGGQRGFVLQGKPDEQFFTKICDVIGQALSQSAKIDQTTPPTRQGEIAALETRGKQLVDYRPDIPLTFWQSAILFKSIEIRSAKNPDKIMSALDEATRVFESILLLDPENNAARTRLAGCLLFKAEDWGGIERDHREERMSRAKECYREVIATGSPEYADDARINLALACGGLDGVEMLRRFGAEAADPKVKARFRHYKSELLRSLEHELPIEAVMPHLCKQLIDELTDVQGSSNELAVVSLDEVLFAWRFNPDTREEIINPLLPELIAKFPSLEPHILLAAAGEQITTNSPVTAQFLASLKSCEANPETVWRYTNYFTHLSTTAEDEKAAGFGWAYADVYGKAFRNHQYSTVVALALARQRAAEKGFAPPLTEPGKRLLAESYLALKQWKQALELFNALPGVPAQVLNECRIHLGLVAESEAVPDSAWKDQHEVTKVVIAYQCIERQQWSTAIDILESIGPRTVRMSGSGPWGYAFTPVLPAVVADECRVKAGMPAIKDPMRFEIGETPYISFSPNGSRMFSIEPEGDDLWMSMYSQIKLFRGDGPFTAGKPVTFHEFERSTLGGNTSICVSPDYIWAGTFDDGLLELNRRTGECRRFTMNEGLVLNGISGLALQDQTLWIAYRNGANGAIGKLDLKSHKFSTLTPNLSPAAGANSQPYYNQAALDSVHQPPNLPVTCMAAGEPGEMWFAVANKGLQRFRNSTGTWETPSHSTSDKIRFEAMAADPTHSLLWLAKREYFEFDHRFLKGGLSIYNYHEKREEVLHIQDGLPSHDVTAVATDGKIAWVGGRGFVAVVDMHTRKVLRVAYISTSRIHQIRLNQTYAWIAVSCDKNGYPDAGNALSGVYRLRRSDIEPAELAANSK